MKTRLKHQCALLYMGLALSGVMGGTAIAQEPIQMVPTSEPTTTPSIVAAPTVSLPMNTVNGHTFLPLSLIPQAFTTSQATLKVTGAHGTFSGISALGTSRDFSLLGAAATLEAQVSILRHIALSVAFTGKQIVGANAESVIGFGANLGTQWNIGAAYNFVETDSMLLTVGLNFSKPHVINYALNNVLNQGLRGIIQTGPDFASEAESTVWRPNLRFAWAFDPTFGIQSFIGFKFASLNPGSTEASSSLLGGIALDTNLNPVLRIPVGVSLTYFRNQVLSSGDSNVNLGSIGLFETILKRVNFGAELGLSRANSVDSTIGAVVARAYY